MATRESSARSAPLRTSGKPENGHRVRDGSALRRADVMGQAAGVAHKDATGNSTRAAALHGRTDRQHRRDYQTGPREVVLFLAFLMESEDPYRYEAEARVAVKLRAVQRLSDADLIERIRDLLRREKESEMRDTQNDLSRDVSWIERAAGKERDSAIGAELAACFLECAARGLGEREVLP